MFVYVSTVKLLIALRITVRALLELFALKKMLAISYARVYTCFFRAGQPDPGRLRRGRLLGGGFLRPGDPGRGRGSGLRLPRAEHGGGRAAKEEGGRRGSLGGEGTRAAEKGRGRELARTDFVQRPAENWTWTLSIWVDNAHKKN